MRHVIRMVTGCRIAKGWNYGKGSDRTIILSKPKSLCVFVLGRCCDMWDESALERSSELFSIVGQNSQSLYIPLCPNL